MKRFLAVSLSTLGVAALVCALLVAVKALREPQCKELERFNAEINRLDATQTTYEWASKQLADERKKFEAEKAKLVQQQTQKPNGAHFLGIGAKADGPWQELPGPWALMKDRQQTIKQLRAAQDIPYPIRDMVGKFSEPLTLPKGGKCKPGAMPVTDTDWYPDDRVAFCVLPPKRASKPANVDELLRRWGLQEYSNSDWVRSWAKQEIESWPPWPITIESDKYVNPDLCLDCLAVTMNPDETRCPWACRKKPSAKDPTKVVPVEDPDQGFLTCPLPTRTPQ